MYEAKRAAGRHRDLLPATRPYSAERLALLGELRRALDHDELVLHFQPKVAAEQRQRDRRRGARALAAPERGLLGPASSSPRPSARASIGDITRWVLDAALRQCARWRRSGLELPVAVNLARANIVDATLPDAVAEILRAGHGSRAALECEISEDTVMGDPRARRRRARAPARARRAAVARRLRHRPLSLSYLKRLPLDEVKIDRSFVIGMADDPSDAAIVRSTIDLARHLGLEVVAEGVETTEVLDVLAALQCDVAQGFLLSRPLPAAEFDGWLAARA
jgi:EAL domain-containing protein (putative c-di-GMP-specific phosphodiesterase class I)